MKQLHNKVNIVPVIAKADTLTKNEVNKLKKKILDEITENGIRIYPLPDCDSDEEDDYKEQVRISLNVINSKLSSFIYKRSDNSKKLCLLLLLAQQQSWILEERK